MGGGGAWEPTPHMQGGRARTRTSVCCHTSTPGTPWCFSRQQQPCPGTCVWPSPLCGRPGAPEVVRRESVALSWESRRPASAHRPHLAVLAAWGPGSPPPSASSRCPPGFRAVPIRDAPLCPLCFSASAPRGPACSCLRAGSSQIGLLPASLSLGRPCRAGSSKFLELHASRTNSPAPPTPSPCTAFFSGSNAILLCCFTQKPGHQPRAGLANTSECLHHETPRADTHAGPTGHPHLCLAPSIPLLAATFALIIAIHFLE